jgi:hypothetical protein
MVGWLVSAIGYLGPWIRHPTAGLTLSGVDMGEFVKFLPGVVDGSLGVVRQLFYLPPFVTAITVGLLVGCRRLRYAWPTRTLALILALLVSLQLLPPAWSPTSLLTLEFRLQTFALGVCWLVLAGHWLLGRIQAWLLATISGILAVAATILPIWQLLLVKPEIDMVYGVPPAIGWALPVCLAGLVLVATAGLILVLRTRPGGTRP